MDGKPGHHRNGGTSPLGVHYDDACMKAYELWVLEGLTQLEVAHQIARLYDCGDLVINRLAGWRWIKRGEKLWADEHPLFDTQGKTSRRMRYAARLDWMWRSVVTEMATPDMLDSQRIAQWNLLRSILPLEAKLHGLDAAKQLEVSGGAGPVMDPRAAAVFEADDRLNSRANNDDGDGEAAG